MAWAQHIYLNTEHGTTRIQMGEIVSHQSLVCSNQIGKKGQYLIHFWIKMRYISVNSCRQCLAGWIRQHCNPNWNGRMHAYDSWVMTMIGFSCFRYLIVGNCKELNTDKLNWQDWNHVAFEPDISWNIAHQSQTRYNSIAQTNRTKTFWPMKNDAYKTHIYLIVVPSHEQ